MVLLSHSRGLPKEEGPLGSGFAFSTLKVVIVSAMSAAPKHTWIATCPHSTVEVLADELHVLGIRDETKMHSGVLFECDLETAYLAHLALRTASRIQRVVARFTSANLSELQSGLNKIDWAKWLRSHKPFNVRPAYPDEDVVKLVAQSIQESKFEKSPPRFDPDADEPITITPFIREGICVMGIDSAGRALHKRGWRTTGHPAVIKETLAASILMLAGYKGDEPLYEPMCGSGTIAIEAAYIALGKAPLIHRKKGDFALEHLAGFDRELWRKVSDQLRTQKKSALPTPIFASDINSKYVEVARKGAVRARVEKYIQFKVGRFQDLEPPAESGLLIANLPYGERIGRSEVERLYTEVGRMISDRYRKWRVALLVPSGAPVALLKLRSAKVFSLKNGALPVKLLVGE